jgi:hypothetical protein
MEFARLENSLLKLMYYDKFFKLHFLEKNMKNIIDIYKNVKIKYF